MRENERRDRIRQNGSAERVCGFLGYVKRNCVVVRLWHQATGGVSVFGFLFLRPCCSLSFGLFFFSSSLGAVWLDKGVIRCNSVRHSAVSFRPTAPGREHSCCRRTVPLAKLALGESRWPQANEWRRTWQGGGGVQTARKVRGSASTDWDF